MNDQAPQPDRELTIAELKTEAHRLIDPLSLNGTQSQISASSTQGIIFDRCLRSSSMKGKIHCTLQSKVI